MIDMVPKGLLIHYMVRGPKPEYHIHIHIHVTSSHNNVHCSWAMQTLDHNYNAQQ